MLRQQFLACPLLFHLLEAGEMPFCRSIPHPIHSAASVSAEGFSIVGICFLALPGKFGGREREHPKMAHAPLIRAAVNPTQEFLFVQEKIAGSVRLGGIAPQRDSCGDGDRHQEALRIADSSWRKPHVLRRISARRADRIQR